MSNLDDLPKTIGKAELKVGDRFFADEKLLEIPRTTKKIFPLDGNQFVGVIPQRYGSDEYVFFGVDEAPFFIGLSNRAVRAVLSGNPERFYESLKPWIIRELPKFTKDIPVRQGDVWGIKVADRWEDIKDQIFHYHLLPKTFGKHYRYYKIPKDKVWIEEGAWSLFGTRHVLTGKYMDVHVVSSKKQNLLLAKGEDVKNKISIEIFLSSGILTAPNHEPLNLENGVYALARSIGISKYRGITGGD
jgi:hypothetical protein